MRPDSAVSQRLQQASEQLQAAIRSTRRRRQSFTDISPQNSVIDSDKEWKLEPTVVLATQEYESDEAFNNGEGQLIQWGEEHMSEQDDASIATSLAYISSSHSPMKGEEVRAVEAVQEEQEKNVGGFAENDLRRALDWMQRDVEQRARENRAVRETLARAIHDITGVIADCVDSEAAKLLLHAATVATGTEAGVGNNAGVIELLPDKVDDLVNQWEDALVSWREQCVVDKRELVDGFALFEEECLARMQAGEGSHRLEQERLQHQASERQMASEDYASALLRELENSQHAIERQQMQVEDLSSHLAAAITVNAQTSAHKISEIQAREADFQDVIDIAAQAKVSELRALRYEIALINQTQRTSETECRLLMLLEECQARHHPNVASSDTVQMYQQKLELLESRMQDVLQQVACDHEQFEYEQVKWALEKRQRREKYDEVLDASVKVLKVLIIREKLMKKHERTQQRGREEIQEQQLNLARQVASLQGMTKELMQECAMVLLVLQQLTVLKTNTCQGQNARSSWTLPAKPVQMKSMIKRLRKMEMALGRRDWAAAVESAIATKVWPYPVHEDS